MGVCAVRSAVGLPAGWPSAMRLLRIGSRGSMLAMAQAGWVKQQVEDQYPGVSVEIVRIKTSGDRFVESPIKAIGGKGIFVKEIEEALLQREIDLAVHSMKDLPTEITPGLVIGATPKREDPRDAWVSGNGMSLDDLAAGSTVGTGSLRRRAQILHRRPDLSVVGIRGNVDTRLKKLEHGEVNALVMAAAGLIRIGRGDCVTEYLGPEICLSAVAQGALGLECREGDSLRGEIAFLHDEATHVEVTAERSFMRRLGGGCHVPVGGRAWAEGRDVRLWGVVADSEGGRCYRGEMSGPASDAERLGRELAERLLVEGASDILLQERSDP